MQYKPNPKIDNYVLRKERERDFPSFAMRKPPRLIINQKSDLCWAEQCWSPDGYVWVGAGRDRRRAAQTCFCNEDARGFALPQHGNGTQTWVNAQWEVFLKIFPREPAEQNVDLSSQLATYTSLLSLTTGPACKARGKLSSDQAVRISCGKYSKYR